MRCCAGRIVAAKCNPEPPGGCGALSAVDHIGNLGADRSEAHDDDSLHRGDRRVHVETAATGAAAGSGAPSSSVLEQGRADRDALVGQIPLLAL